MMGMSWGELFARMQATTVAYDWPYNVGMLLAPVLVQSVVPDVTCYMS